MDAAKTETIESELDRIIEKRAAERKDANHVAELWRETARIHPAAITTSCGAE